MDLPSFLPLLIEMLIKSAAILVAAGLVSHAWRGASAAQRHAIWLAAFFTLLLLPATRLIAPRWNLASPPRAQVIVRRMVEPMSATANLNEPVAALAETVSAPTRSFRLDWRALAMGLWVTGSVMLLGRRAFGSMRLRSMLRASSAAQNAQFTHARRIAVEFGVTRFIALRVSPVCRVPLTWGTWRPVLMLPEDCAAWPGHRLLAALRHELAHILRGDYAVRMIADFVRALYWPNPLVWLASRALRTAQEQACDDVVLNAGTCPTDYATLLYEAARRFAAPHGAVAMAQPSTLESRILAIVNAARDRRPLTLRTSILGALFVAVTLVGSTAAQLRDVGPVASLKPQKIDIQANFVDLKPEIKDTEALLSSLGLVPKADAKPESGVRLLKGTSFDALTTMLGIKKRTVATDFNSIPGVTTKSGQRAVIEFFREYRYATEWKKGAKDGAWKATAFETTSCGTTLEAVPVIQADGTIALRAVPQVVEFLGFINLETGEPMPPGTEGNWLPMEEGRRFPNEDSVPEGPRLKAVFSCFKLDTNVVLQAGETAVLGPLKQIGDVKRFEDRVPKTKPVVFVTAAVVGANETRSPANK